MSNTSQEFHFFSVFSRIPLISYSLNIGINLYDHLKANQYLSTTLSTTEQLVVYIANTQSVLKVANKLEKPLVFVDSFACDSLQMLEQKYPSIRMAPEELREEAFNQMLVLKGFGVRKLDEVMHGICRQRRIGMHKAMAFLEALLDSRASIYVDIIERTVDDYLPPIEDRNDDQNDDQSMEPMGRQKVFTRLVVIPHKVQERLVQRYNQFVFGITFNEN